jgi:hypothetical protein
MARPTKFRIPEPKPALRDTVIEHLAQLPDLDTRRVGKDNVMPSLRNVFIWQEALAFAMAQHKLAWENAQEPNGPVPDDDRLRKYDLGDTTVLTTTRFAMTIKVSPPRLMFDRDAFIEAVAKKFRLNPEKLFAIAGQVATETRPPLTKRVIELDETENG